MTPGQEAPQERSRHMQMRRLGLSTPSTELWAGVEAGTEFSHQWPKTQSCLCDRTSVETPRGQVQGAFELVTVPKAQRGTTALSAPDLVL